MGLLNYILNGKMFIYNQKLSLKKATYIHDKNKIIIQQKHFTLFEFAVTSFVSHFFYKNNIVSSKAITHFNTKARI